MENLTNLLKESAMEEWANDILIWVVILIEEDTDVSCRL